MPVLKYHNGTAWTEVSTAGPQGPAGPAGADSTVPGPAGATGAAGADGLPGPSAVSADANNIATLGSDSLIHVPDNYLPLTGGTIAPGPLVVSADPVQPMEVATKQYVDAQYTTGVFTLASGWVEYAGAGYAGLLLTRSGNIVVIQGMISPTTAKTLTWGLLEAGIATIPVGFRPVANTTSIGSAHVSSSNGDVIKIIYRTTGAIDIGPAIDNTSIAAESGGGYLTIQGTWRAA